MDYKSQLYHTLRALALMRKVRVGPDDWVVQAAVQSNSNSIDSFSQHGSLQPGTLMQMINDDKHTAEPRGERWTFK